MEGSIVSIIDTPPHYVVRGKSGSVHNAGKCGGPPGLAAYLALAWGKFCELSLHVITAIMCHYQPAKSLTISMDGINETGAQVNAPMPYRQVTPTTVLIPPWLVGAFEDLGEITDADGHDDNLMVRCASPLTSELLMDVFDSFFAADIW